MKRTIVALVAVLCVACGSSPYDAEEDCRKSRDCAAEQGQSPPNSLESCVATSQALYDNATSSQQRQMEDVFLRCRDLSACAYITCVTKK